MILSMGKDAEVEDKARFKQRIDWWFEHDVIEKGQSHE
jgi:hypothetical protein